MNKINGYTEEEAKRLVEYIKDGKRAGKTLTKLFASYGVENGRARGSVRNYYYALMKNRKGDERIVKLLDGSSLKVEQIREFTEEETDQALKSILLEKSKGLRRRGPSPPARRFLLIWMPSPRTVREEPLLA